MGIARDYGPYRMGECGHGEAVVSRGAVRVPKPGSTDGSDRVHRHHSHQMNPKETNAIASSMLGPACQCVFTEERRGNYETIMSPFDLLFNYTSGHHHWTDGCWATYKPVNYNPLYLFDL